MKYAVVNTNEERLKNIVRHLLKGDLDAAENEVRHCG